MDKGKAKVEGTTSNTRFRDIQCFKCLGKGHFANQCPNPKHIMFIEESNEYYSEEELEENEEVEKTCEEEEETVDESNECENKIS